MRCDIAIVGAGASGSFLAYNLAKKGFKTVVIEKKSAIGGKVCGGFVSSRVVNLSNTDAVVNEIKGADIVFPDGKCIRIDGGKIYGYVIDRDAFDKELAQKAMAEGALYKLGFTVDRIGDSIVCGNEKIMCDYVVGADGAKSTVARQFNMGTVRYVNTVQGECRDWTGDPDYVRVLLDTSLSPGFFSWFIPYRSKVKVGLGSFDTGLKQKLDRLASKYKISLDNIRGGIIPVGMRQFSKSNIVLMGDAAGFVKATSGGGLFLGLSAAKLLADNFGDWKRYKKEFMRGYGREIKKTLIAHRIFSRMTNDDFNRIADYIKKDIEVVSQYGDIDYQSSIAKLLVKRHPSLLWLGRKLIR